MTEFKGTPGPWCHDLDDGDKPEGVISAVSGGCVAFVQPHGNINTVVREGQEFSHADAQLIAAAPDLLEACQLFAKGKPESGLDHWMLGVAHAAIAKALGKEPT